MRRPVSATTGRDTMRRGWEDGQVRIRLLITTIVHIAMPVAVLHCCVMMMATIPSCLLSLEAHPLTVVEISAIPLILQQHVVGPVIGVM